MKSFIFSFFLIILSTGVFAQYTTHTLHFGGATRQYILYVPPAYDSTRPTAFVLALHGIADDMNKFKNTIQMDLVADTANFIFAVPQAMAIPIINTTAWNCGVGFWGVALNYGVDDVGFLNALIDSVSAVYNIDQHRLFSTGFSMGGFMSNRLACELNYRFAAIASVSGTIANGISCHPEKPIPVAHFHGTADQTVGYSNNLYGLNAEELVSYWRKHDQCDSVPTIDTFPDIANDGKRVVHYKYAHGADSMDVELFKVINGTHDWLDTAHDINYAIEIWRFFSRYGLREQPTTTSVPSPEDDADINIFPNPANGVLNINLSEPVSRISEIAISDVTGRIVYAEHAIPESQRVSINTYSMTNGLYFVSIKLGGRLVNRKVYVSN